MGSRWGTVENTYSLSPVSSTKLCESQRMHPSPCTAAPEGSTWGTNVALPAFDIQQCGLEGQNREDSMVTRPERHLRNKV